MIIDARDEGERSGGHIQCSVHLPGSGSRAQDCALTQMAAEWRRGKNLVLYCTRSLSRAPVAAQHLIRILESQAGTLAKDSDGRVERIALLEGGICNYLQFALRETASRRPCIDVSDELLSLSESISGFDPDMWLLSGATEDGQVAHVSEYPEIADERRAAKVLVDAEMSDELAFLVDKRCSLSPPAATCMPYIS